MRLAGFLRGETEWRFGIMRLHACEHFVKDDAQRVEVGGFDATAFFQLFGRHVGESPDHSACGRK